ncbi:MAG: DUF1214 domain-containing protein [Actinobacteria bacterium]|nr:DUF1214 domain-containing protein [Actinomycetota bacterium]
MFAAIVQQAGGTGLWSHGFTPTAVDLQPVIRMNRDTLYSGVVVDVSAGAVLELPDAGDRYVSAMVVNQDHHINRIFHEPGTHQLTAADLGSDFVLVAVRILVDPEDPADVAEVNRLQRELRVTSTGSRAFVLPDYDEASFSATRSALLELAKGMGGLDRCFGTAEEVDPVRHLIGAAAGWGGLPEREAMYVNVVPELPVGEYELRVHDVPVDGFWSISLYNEAGYFEANPQGAYSVNNITGIPDEDGAITIRFGAAEGVPNALPIMPGWNYLARLYRPRAEVRDGSWTFPRLAEIGG